MKRLTLLALFIMVLSIIKYNYQEEVIVHKDTIRFRVIANSNDTNDQKIKKQLASTLRAKLTTLLAGAQSIEESRNIINNNLDSIAKDIDSKIDKDNYSINYGLNYFPEKVDKGVKYQEGYYESLVVTLGNGLGENFWCILFPPLCLLEAEDENKEEIEYKFLVKELINKYF